MSNTALISYHNSYFVM